VSVGADEQSIINGDDSGGEKVYANPVSSTISTKGVRRESSDIGTFSSGSEHLVFYLERGTANVFQLDIAEGNNFTRVGILRFDWSQDSIVNQKGIIADFFPIRDDLYIFSLKYDPTNVAGSDFSGNGRFLNFKPDLGGNDNTTIFHHAQLSENRPFILPAVTGGSQITVNADTYTLTPSEWNNEQGTVFVSGWAPATAYNIFLRYGGQALLGINSAANKKAYFYSSPEVVSGWPKGNNGLFRVKMLLSWGEQFVESWNGNARTSTYSGELSSKRDLRLENKFIFEELTYSPRQVSTLQAKTLTATPFS
jgi:hypothetical protein